MGILISANIPISRVYLNGKDDVKGAQTSDSASRKTHPKIATGSGKVGFINNKFGAVTTFPLSLNPNTGTLSVTTPKGEKTVTVLPDAAISNMLTSKVMSYVTSVPAEGELASTDKLITLIEKDGLLVFEIDGVREYKLLGFIPIKSKVKSFVSAENGQVIKTEQSLLGRILNKIAP